jgi:hypothetical protein
VKARADPGGREHHDEAKHRNDAVHGIALAGETTRQCHDCRQA